MKKPLKKIIKEKRQNVDEFARMVSTNQSKSIIDKKFSKDELKKFLNGLGFDTKGREADKNKMIDFMIDLFKRAGKSIDNRDRETKLSSKQLPI